MWDTVITSFPQFLGGDASKWFYRYRRMYRNLNWQQLKVDMITHFRGTDTEESLWCKIANRRQGDRETFDKFYNSLLDLQDRISRRFSDDEMIGILRQNVKFDIKKCLVAYNTTNLTEFVNKCRLTDKLLHPQLYYEHAPYSRKVAEIESDVCVEEPSLEVEAFSTKRPQNLNALANLKCWNCDNFGHGYQTCEEPRKMFCYWCGHKNSTCKTCPNCNSNFRPVGKPQDPPP